MQKIVGILVVLITLSVCTNAQTYNLQIGDPGAGGILAEFPNNNQALFRPFNTTAGSTGGIKLFELAANGANYTGFRAPDILSGDYLYTLPNGYGTSGYFLRTDGAGGLTWSNDVPSGDGDYIHNQNSGNQTANWRITGTGQWGGATSKGTLSADQGSSLELGGTGSPYIDLANATGDDFDARIQLNGDDYLNIAGTNVGINNTSPGNKLDIVGGATRTGTHPTGLALYATANFFTGRKRC
jgi:hypothetical protein